MVADRSAKVAVYREHRLVFRKVAPFGRVSVDNAVILRVVINYCLHGSEKDFLVASVVMPADKTLQQVPQQVSPYRHEEAYEVALKHPGFLGVVIGYLPHSLFRSLDRCQCSESLATVERDVTHLLESLLKQWFQPDDDPMMNDTVTEIRCENFSQFRVFYKKTNGYGWQIYCHIDFVG